MSMDLAERDYLRALFDGFPTGVLIADDSGCYVGANQAACALLDRTREQILGSRVSDLVATVAHTEVDLQWRAFLRDGQQSGVFRVQLPDGRSRDVHFHAQANFVPGLHCSFLSPVPASLPALERDEVVLTICAWTKRVRTENGWVSIEQYLRDAHGLLVSHGMAPDVFERIVRDESR